MARITVLGAGNMGSAVARVFAAAGHEVTVWNRTRSRADGLADVASVADTAAAAVDGADMIVISLANYDAVMATLDNAQCKAALKGRTVVQLTSGAPSEARRAGSWAAENSIDYLDGAVMAYPSGVGTDEATLLYAGDRALFDRHRPLLRALAGDKSVYVAEPIGAAACMELAVVMPYFAAAAAFMHGAAMCQGEGVPVEAYFERRDAAFALIKATAETWLPMAARRDYALTEASAQVHLDGMGMLVRLSREAQIDSSFPTALQEVWARAVHRGHADAEGAAIFETFIEP